MTVIVISQILTTIGAVLLGSGFCENIKFSEKIGALRLAIIYLIIGATRIDSGHVIFAAPMWAGIMMAAQALTPSDEARLPREKLYWSLSLRMISAVLLVAIGILSMIETISLPVILLGILWLVAGATYFAAICLIMHDMRKFKDERDSRERNLCIILARERQESEEKDDVTDDMSAYDVD